jgi:hypothetical protein
VTYEEEVALFRRGLGESYVYGKFRPDGTPFYFGESYKPKRMMAHDADARRSQAGPCTRIIQGMLERGEPVRSRKIYEGLSWQRSHGLEEALIDEHWWRFHESGEKLLVNERHYAPKPPFVVEIRRKKHLWTLPPLTRLLVSREAADSAPHMFARKVGGRHSVWVDQDTLSRLETIRGGSGGYSEPLLRLTEFMRLAEKMAA